MKKILLGLLSLVCLQTFPAVPGFAAPLTNAFFEGTMGRVVDAVTGVDLVVTPGILVLCEQGATIPCFQVLPDDSDRFVLTAILNVAGAPIATAFKFCSGPDEAGTDAGDNSIDGCSNLTVDQFNATNHAFRTEAAPLNGVELTNYIPANGEPGFGASPYGLVSDVPEPASELLLGFGMIALVATARKRRLW